MTKQKELIGVVVKLPPELYAKLQFQAQANGRAICKEAKQIVINNLKKTK